MLLPRLRFHPFPNLAQVTSNPIEDLRLEGVWSVLALLGNPFTEQRYIL